ncbi:uncharacterized protein METZ01_LOCUS338900 [marine metagenome]|uniref:Uncharacterized protein n=1 Tax=marine metagenome TaxID=408172 RepID=A0A382QKS7_9ZZZZ
MEPSLPPQMEKHGPRRLTVPPISLESPMQMVPSWQWDNKELSLPPQMEKHGPRRLLELEVISGMSPM